MPIKVLPLVVIVATAFPLGLSAQEGLTAKQIMEMAEERMRSDRSVALFEMTVVTPKWKRTMEIISYDDRVGDRSFIHILTPRRDEGTTFLRRGNELWMFRPRSERVTKIPPSMMHNSWMGSDFTNDDLVKESSYITDYTHEMAGREEVEGRSCYKLILTPKPEAAVTWGRIEALILPDPLVPVGYRFYNRRGELNKEMSLPISNINEMDGVSIPTIWIMSTEDKPGHRTVITVNRIDFNAELPDSFFRDTALRNPPRYEFPEQESGSN